MSDSAVTLPPFVQLAIRLDPVSTSPRPQGAGSHPKPLHRHAERALREYGIDLSGHRPRHLDTYATERFDYVISLCDRVREVCPAFPDHPGLIHWSIPDPGASTTPGGTTGDYGAFRRTAAELDSRVRFLIPVLNQE